MRRPARRSLGDGPRRPLRYALLDSPLGPLLAAASGRGVARLAFADRGAEPLLEELALRTGVEPRPDRRALARLARELDAYFLRRARAFSSPVDLSLVPEGFARRVLEATARIPYGTVATYGRIAALAGSPRAARAAGNALSGNPVALLVPCHRVVPADGTIGGYGGDEARKEALLRLEGALADAAPGRVSLRRPPDAREGARSDPARGSLVV
ncbi:MAG TPA: methylated-DNA--[protein]-cysteine S-methyltransferase [Actinomycetota bacterium]|nr:methylated-DNA--[protein]-cysteine S-methyltransferase [Actinomycetota bacterium]